MGDVVDLALEYLDGRAVERADQRQSLHAVPPVAEHGEMNVWDVDRVLHLPVGATFNRASGNVAWVGSMSTDGTLDWALNWRTRGPETSISLAPDGSSYVIHNVPGGDDGTDARIRNVTATGEVLSTARFDPGSLDVEMTSIAAIGIGCVVAAAVEPPVGGYVVRFG